MRVFRRSDVREGAHARHAERWSDGGEGYGDGKTRGAIVSRARDARVSERGRRRRGARRSVEKRDCHLVRGIGGYGARCERADVTRDAGVSRDNALGRGYGCARAHDGGAVGDW